MKLLKVLGKIIFHKSIFRVTEYNVKAIENKTVILCPNHVSDADGPIFWSSTKNVTIMAKKECFKNKLVSIILNKLNIVSVDRDSKNGRELRQAIKLLEDGKQKNMVYMLFPQGTISDINKNTINRVKPGAFYISIKTGIPIVPAFIEQPRFFKKSRIIYGDEMNINNDSKTVDKDVLLDARQKWKEEVLKLQYKAELLEDKPIRTLRLNYKHSNNNNG